MSLFQIQGDVKGNEKETDSGTLGLIGFVKFGRF